ncbi:MAG: trimeric intracellular cation channel family protein [Verrucomicrobiota bacterium]
MQYALEHFAVAVCAVTGVLAGRGKQLDLFGVVVLALVTALGGGTVRDLVLNVSPIFWIADPRYVHTAVIAALATFIIARFWELPQTVLLIADAFGLALFTMIGVEKSLACGAAPTIAIFLGVVTGVGGGLMRDVLSGEIPLVFRRGIYLYATAAFCGAGLFLLLNHFFPGQPQNRLLAIGAILILRLAGIRWKLGLPLFQPRSAAPTGRKPNVFSPPANS